MKKVFSPANWLCLVLLAACQAQPDRPAAGNDQAFYMPAEYETQAAVWLGWTDSPSYQKVFFDLTEALYPDVPVKVVAETDAALAALKDSLSRRGMDVAAFSFQVIADNRHWMRDHGATYVVNKRGEKRVVDFGWTLYGNRPWLTRYYDDNADSVAFYYARALGETGRVDSLMGAGEGHRVLKTDVNMEGGSIEVNGRGTLILTESVTFQRNPGKSRAYLEAEFRRVLGVQQVIWLKEGLAEDGFWWNRIYGNHYGWGVGGHTDEFVRFVNDTTLLLAWVDEDERAAHPLNELNYVRMAENLKILEAARDVHGRPFRVVKFPLPDPQILATVVTARGHNHGLRYQDWTVGADWGPERGRPAVGDSVRWVAAASYLNYLVTNGRVLMSSYVAQGSSPAKEARAVALMQEAFPDRALVLLDVMSLNYNGGGIHCSTQQEPAAVGR